MTAKYSKEALDVGIVTREGDRALAFYRDVLGFRPIDPLKFPGIGFIHRLVHGKSVFRILVPEQLPPESQPVGLTDRVGIQYMTLNVSNLDEVLDDVRAGGGEVLLGPIDVRPGVRAGQLRDPDGNLIELLEGA